MTRDPPTTTGMRGRYGLWAFPTAPAPRSVSSAFGRRDPFRNSSTVTRCAKCRSKELRNRCADLRRGIREEREVHIENFELRSCQ
jgi:hypothetical protein